METCGVKSLGDYQGGVTMVARGGQCSSTGAHACQLEAGHSGPHAKRSLLALGADAGMQTTYIWNDEHALTAEVSVVSLPPPERKG